MIISERNIGKHKLVLRTATVSDAEALAELDQICFSVPWSRQSFETDLADSDKNVYLVWEARFSKLPAADVFAAAAEGVNDVNVESLVIGYGGFWQIIDEAEIMNIAIRPGWRRLSLASELLGTMISIAGTRNLKSMSLEVRTGNDAALALYRNFGFEQAGVRRKYYPDNEEDAIIMLKKM